MTVLRFINTRTPVAPPGRRLAAGLLILAVASSCASCSGDSSPSNGIRTWWLERQGINPTPVRLKRPQSQPLSAIARLGHDLYFDPALSVSGRLSCASCHDPAHAFGPANDLPAQFGGPELRDQGMRAAPSLTYLYRLPAFSIGPESSQDPDASASPPAATPITASPARPKVAGTTSHPPDWVPQGGLFWDGRANSLQSQAAGPLYNPAEMGNTDAEAVAAKLRQAVYRDDFAKLFGAWVLNDSHMLVNEALLAIARFQVEDAGFHAYTSKFDYWLEGRARFTSQEMHGYRLFNDPKRANCGGCHIDTVGTDGQPPLLTDNEYEALAVPRNPELGVNRDPAFFDLGLCGPVRGDLQQQSQYCGMFRTPSLRNVALRRVFFHNGRYRSLPEVLAFYNFRDSAPERIYPKLSDGRSGQYDDLPPQYRGNVDVTDTPFGRSKAEGPAMTQQDMNDIVAFLETLTDSYSPDR